MTKIVNLYGGPGTGKSTCAAFLFARLKMAGHNAELVKETVKDWAWERRVIDPYAQFYLMGRQIRRESMLLNRVSHIVTDAPIYLFDYYATRFSPPDMAAAVQATVRAYYAQLAADGHEVEHVFLTRSRAYNPLGRYQTEQEAIAIDTDLHALLTARNVSFSRASTNEVAMGAIAERL